MQSKTKKEPDISRCDDPYKNIYGLNTVKNKNMKTFGIITNIFFRITKNVLQLEY